MQNSVEIRLRKTLAALAYKGVDKISVSALCKKAEVSRASFYLYYKDMDDFIVKNREYIIYKLIEQLGILLDVKDGVDITNQRVVFSDEDIVLLKGYIGNHVYWDFAIDANRIITPRFNQKMIERWGEDYFNENREKFEFVLNGGVASLCLDLLNFNKSSYIKNMKRITDIANEIFSS